MNTYISDIFPKLNRFSKKLDDLTLLTNQHWVVLDELEKNVFIFRSNKELLISRNGKIKKGKWEYLGNSSLMIEDSETSYLLKHGFLDENVLALRVDGKNEYAILVNENNYNGDLNSYDKVIEFLSTRYLNTPSGFHSINTDSSPTNAIVEEVKTDQQEDFNAITMILIIVAMVTVVWAFVIVMN